MRLKELLSKEIVNCWLEILTTQKNRWFGHERTKKANGLKILKCFVVAQSLTARSSQCTYHHFHPKEALEEVSSWSSAAVNQLNICLVSPSLRFLKEKIRFSNNRNNCNIQSCSASSHSSHKRYQQLLPGQFWKTNSSYFCFRKFF